MASSSGRNPTARAKLQNPTRPSSANASSRATRYSALAKIGKIGFQFEKNHVLYFSDARTFTDDQVYKAVFPLWKLFGYQDSPIAIHGDTWRTSVLFPLDFPWELKDHITADDWRYCTDEIVKMQEKYNSRAARLWSLLVQRPGVPARYRYTSHVLNFRPCPCKCWYKTKESNFSSFIFLLEMVQAIIRALVFGIFAYLIGVIVDLYCVYIYGSAQIDKKIKSPWLQEIYDAHPDLDMTVIEEEMDADLDALLKVLSKRFTEVNMTKWVGLKRVVENGDTPSDTSIKVHALFFAPKAPNKKVEKEHTHSLNKKVKPQSSDDLVGQGNFTDISTAGIDQDNSDSDESDGDTSDKV